MQKGQFSVLFCVRNFRQSTDYISRNACQSAYMFVSARAFNIFLHSARNRLRKMLRLRYNNINKTKE